MATKTKTLTTARRETLIQNVIPLYIEQITELAAQMRANSEQHTHAAEVTSGVERERYKNLAAHERGMAEQFDRQVTEAEAIIADLEAMDDDE